MYGMGSGRVLPAGPHQEHKHQRFTGVWWWCVCVCVRTYAHVCVSCKPGEQGGYRQFVGKDASKAFITGDFREDLEDDVTELDNDAYKALVDWRSFYRRVWPWHCSPCCCCCCGGGMLLHIASTSRPCSWCRLLTASPCRAVGAGAAPNCQPAALRPGRWSQADCVTLHTLRVARRSCNALCCPRPMRPTGVHLQGAAHRPLLQGGWHLHAAAGARRVGGAQVGAGRAGAQGGGEEDPLVQHALDRGRRCVGLCVTDARQRAPVRQHAAADAADMRVAG
jgi:hypothetical protein